MTLYDGHKEAIFNKNIKRIRDSTGCTLDECIKMYNRCEGNWKKTERKLKKCQKKKLRK